MVASEYDLPVSDQHWQQAQTVMPQVMLSDAESGRTEPSVKTLFRHISRSYKKTAAYD